LFALDAEAVTWDWLVERAVVVGRPKRERPRRIAAGAWPSVAHDFARTRQPRFCLGARVKSLGELLLALALM
jgi:hypothetical protein